MHSWGRGRLRTTSSHPVWPASSSFDFEARPFYHPLLWAQFLQRMGRIGRPPGAGGSLNQGFAQSTESLLEGARPRALGVAGLLWTLPCPLEAGGAVHQGRWERSKTRAPCQAGGRLLSGHSWLGMQCITEQFFTSGPIGLVMTPFSPHLSSRAWEEGDVCSVHVTCCQPAVTPSRERELKGTAPPFKPRPRQGLPAICILGTTALKRLF